MRVFRHADEPSSHAEDSADTAAWIPEPGPAPPRVHPPQGGMIKPPTCSENRDRFIISEGPT